MRLWNTEKSVKKSPTINNQTPPFAWSVISWQRWNVHVPVLPNWSCSNSELLLSFLQCKCSLYEVGYSQCPWKPLLRRCYFNIWRALISFHKDSLFHGGNKHHTWQMQGRSKILSPCGGRGRPIKLFCVSCIMVHGASDVFPENQFCGITVAT